MCEISDALRKLNLSECESLSYVGTGPVRDRLPTTHATKLLKLGLAELSCGRIELTPMGRRAILKLPQRGA
jgi:hypothetical protein